MFALSRPDRPPKKSCNQRNVRKCCHDASPNVGVVLATIVVRGTLVLWARLAEDCLKGKSKANAIAPIPAYLQYHADVWLLGAVSGHCDSPKYHIGSK